MRRFLTTLVCLLLPAPFKPWLLSALGHRVHRSARIGPSLVSVGRLYMGPGTRIAALTVLSCPRVCMRRGAWIGAANIVRGPFSLFLAEGASLGNRNIVSGARRPRPGEAAACL